MIESRYWKDDLLNHAKALRAVKHPKRWSEKSQVNLEKEIIVSFFKIRKLFETHKVSKKIRTYKADIFRYPSGLEKITNRNYWDIFEVYEIAKETTVKKDIVFICNQLIHGGATFAYRNDDKNWGGIYTCSDFERSKYLYRIPIEEIIKILILVGSDYPTKMALTYSEEYGDYKIEVD